MFIYAGKLQWLNYGQDEAFIVILPHGPARVGDAVYLYTQWTVDSKGVKKGKWFQTLQVQKVVRGAENGNDETLTLSHGYYSWELQCQHGYQTCVVNMSNPLGHKSAMTLARVYQPPDEASTDPARIWTGTFNWPEYATDELFMLVVPEGFGAGRPVLVFSQWTVDWDDKPKVNCYMHGVQQNETPSEDGSLHFSFSYHYRVACNWDDKSYHSLLAQIDDLDSQIRDLTAQIRQLTVAGDAEKKETEELQKKLTESLDAAAKKEAELAQQIQDLRKTLAKDRDHDAEEQRALDAAHEQINKEQEARAETEKQVATLQFALGEAQKRTGQLQAQLSELGGEAGRLRGQLDAEKAHGAELEKQNGDLRAKVAVLDRDAASMKKTLARMGEDLAQAREESDAKDGVIDALEKEVAVVKKQRDAREKAYEELQRTTGATIQALEEEMAALKTQWPASGVSDFPDGAAFPDPFSGPGVIA